MDRLGRRRGHWTWVRGKVLRWSLPPYRRSIKWQVIFVVGSHQPELIGVRDRLEERTPTPTGERKEPSSVTLSDKSNECAPRPRTCTPHQPRRHVLGRQRSACRFPALEGAAFPLLQCRAVSSRINKCRTNLHIERRERMPLYITGFPMLHRCMWM